MTAILEPPAQKNRVRCESIACAVPATVCIHWDDGTESNFCNDHAETAVAFNRTHIVSTERFDS